MTVIDVGVNIDYLSAIAAALVGASGAVLAFEANPICYSRLTENLRPFPNADAYRIALSDSDGTVPFYLYEEDGWGSPVETKHRGEEGQGAINVQMTTLDRFCATNKVQRFGLVKIDVEGTEVAVFRGVQEILRRDRPIVFAEIWRSSKELEPFLQGYRIHQFDLNNICAEPI